MRYALSGCYSTTEKAGMYHDDEKGVYIMADGSHGGKRGLLGEQAVLEAFQALAELPENFSEVDFQTAVAECAVQAQKLIERKVREHVRGGGLDGLVHDKHNDLKQGEDVSEAEHQRTHALAMEKIVEKELEHTSSTALVAVVTEDRLYIANVAGNSRLEVLKRGDNADFELETVTLDHGFLWLRMHGKLPPGALEKEKAYELQRELDQARTEIELGTSDILNEAWKMKDMKGQMISAHGDIEPDFYTVELSDIVSWQLYTQGVIEHSARNRRKKELIDAEKIGIPPVTVAKTIVELSDECEKCTLGMIYARKIAS
jgi:serine/threonine protein phosphatase PrpC